MQKYAAPTSPTNAAAATIPAIAPAESVVCDATGGAGVVVDGTSKTDVVPAKVVVVFATAGVEVTTTLSGPAQPPVHSWSCSPLTLVQRSMIILGNGHVHSAHLAGPAANVVPSQGATTY